jgi:hypothetical protein
MVQGARPHTDEDLILARLGIGDVFVGEDFGPTELVNANSFHGRSWTVDNSNLNLSS